MPDGVCENPTVANLKDRMSTITYGKLNNLYENSFGKKYSPEAEKERKESNLERAMRTAQRQVPK